MFHLSSRRFFVVASLLFALSFGLVLAKPGHDPHMKLKKILAHPVKTFKKVDVDGDGYISLEEWKGAHKHLSRYVEKELDSKPMASWHRRPFHKRKPFHQAKHFGAGKAHFPGMIAIKAVKKAHDVIIATFKAKAKNYRARDMDDDAQAIADDIIETEVRFLSAMSAARHGKIQVAQRELRAIYRKPEMDHSYRLSDKREELEQLHRRRFKALTAEGQQRVVREALDGEIKRLKRDIHQLERSIRDMEETGEEADSKEK